MRYFTTIPNIKFCSNKSPSGWQSIHWDILKQLAASPKKSQAVSISRAKQTAALIAAYDERTREKAKAVSSLFGMLRADIDGTLASIEDLAGLLKQQGLSEFIVYSTLSHSAEQHRFRVMILLSESVPYQLWLVGQWYLAQLLPNCDSCAEKPAQFMLLPCITKESQVDYEFHVECGDSLGKEDLFWAAAEEHADNLDRQADASLKVAPKLLTEGLYKESLIGRQVSIIELLERHIDWPSLLGEFGYLRLGANSWLAPESSSKQAGAHVLVSNRDGKERLFSHHASDPCGGKLVDKLDFIAIRQFSGDQVEALKWVAEVWFPQANEFNRKEWSIYRLSQSFLALKEAR